MKVTFRRMHAATQTHRVRAAVWCLALAAAYPACAAPDLTSVNLELLTDGA